jgi:hypothetical protein
MSLHPVRLAAGLLVTSLAFGAAPVPALADGMFALPPRYHAPRYVRQHVRYVPRVRTVYRTVPRVVYVPQPVQYASPCGGCGSAAVYAPPVQYYNSSCGGCGYGVSGYDAGYVGAGYADYEPQYAPAYSTGYGGYSDGYYGGYSGGYYGGGFVGARFGRVGFGRGFYGGRVGVGRSFYGGRVGIGRGFYGRRAGFR